MKYFVEESLRDFNFWSGGKDRAELLTDEQFDTVEQMMEEMDPADGWTDTAINDFFWFDFDTIAQWLGYADEEHLEKDISQDEVQEAQEWAEDTSTDYDKLFIVAHLDIGDYALTNEDGEEDWDLDQATKDFMDWWNGMADIEQVEEYRKYQ